MIEIKNLSYKIGQQFILKHININIPKHGITALIGPNGAGKSTLFSFMARLEPLYNNGQILFDGKAISNYSSADLARKISILTQENNIVSRIKVYDLLMFGRYPHHQGRPQPEDIAVVDNILQQFQLQDLSNKYITELSGGQRQRALIAMVFCQSTDYILLDEPLNNLDMYHAKTLMQLLYQLTHKQQLTTVVVLHDINQAAAYADYIIAMKNGAVQFSGTPDQVFTVENIKDLFNIDVTILDFHSKKLIVHHL